MTIWAEAIDIDEIEGFERKSANGTLRPSQNKTNLALIGSARSSYGANCEKPTNPGFLKLVETGDVGPFRATGLRPAIDALKRIMAEIKSESPAIYSLLRCEGMLGCRMVRGSTTAISNHSWGTAIDLSIIGATELPGPGMVQRGILEIWPIFNRHGFYWGAAFPQADVMHFEASEQLIQKWAKAGAFGAVSVKGLIHRQTIGDRGQEIKELQTALNGRLRAGYSIQTDICEDGFFGIATRAAVVEFQRRQGLFRDGIAGRKTHRALT